MHILPSLISIDKGAEMPVYQQLVNGFILAIRNGHLPKGAKLPGVRNLALQFGLHRKTVQNALDEVAAQGWIDIFPQKGAYIARNLPLTKPLSLHHNGALNLYPPTTHFDLEAGVVSFFPGSDVQHSGKLALIEGFPDLRIAPLNDLFREMRSLEKRAAYRRYFQYGNPQGTLLLRETLARHLSETRGLPASADNLLITRGAQMGIYLATQLLIQPGDAIVVGDPGYRTATSTFEQAGATILRVPVDEAGIQVETIEALCQTHRIRAAYVIPHHHHPTTVTLGLERRLRLLDLAAEHRFAIIEDDYDFDFHYDSSPITPMASLDQHGSVIYIGTLSKTLAPSIRLGFMVAPVNFIQSATMLRRSIDFQGDSILEIAIANLFKNGTIQGFIKKAVKTYHQRRDHFCALLHDQLGDVVDFKVPAGGMAVWTKFNTIPLASLTQKANEKGVMIMDGSIYDTAHSQHFTRLGFSALNFEEQMQAVEVLRRVVKGG
jgi:GntR family transcriptional regulator / MocR family aminotransferase